MVSRGKLNKANGVVEVKLVQHVTAMHINGMSADAKLIGNFPAAIAFCQQSQDLFFTLAQ